MDPLTMLAFICIFTLVALVVADYHEYHTDQEDWEQLQPAPIPINRDGPRDAA